MLSSTQRKDRATRCVIEADSRSLASTREIRKLIRRARAAVLKSARGTGAGKALLLAQEEAISDMYGKGTKISLASQMHAIPFYAKAGYEQQGEPFDEDGQPHILMTKASS